MVLNVVDAVDGSTIADYKYLINIDNAGDPLQARDAGCSPQNAGYPDFCQWVSVAGVKSNSPILTQGDQSDFASAVVITLLVLLGPERLGTGFVLLAMFTAPQNSVRPIPTADFVTFSDLFLLVGGGLLLPTLLRRRGRYPALFLVGAVGLSAMVLVSAAIGPSRLLGLLYGLRLPAAAVALPFFFLAWRPQGRMVEALAWSYVAGHVLSTCYAVVEGRAINDRYDGLTTHFNFFGIAALMASTMLVHLYHATPRRYRWLVMPSRRSSARRRSA